MDDINVILQQQINDAISIQRELLDKLASGSVPDDCDKISIDICEKVIKNSITVDKYYIDKRDDETYDKCLKNFTDKDTKLY